MVPYSIFDVSYVDALVTLDKSLQKKVYHAEIAEYNLACKNKIKSYSSQLRTIQTEINKSLMKSTNFSFQVAFR